MKYFPKVFVIVLNYNGKDCLQKTLNSVFQINYPNFEVVLVDNNSTDGSLEMARSLFPKMNFIKNSQNFGFSAGNNVGIEYALERSADFVLLLNYDVQVKNDFLLRLVETMENDKRNGVGSPVVLKDKTTKIWFSGGKIKWLKMKAIHKTQKLKKDYFGSNYISGCAMIIRKEVFKKIGLLDENFFLYWEDADFSLRAKRAGFRLVVSARSEVYHIEKSQENVDKKIYWLVISGLIFFKKNTPLLLRPWILSYTILRKIKNKRDIRFRKNSTNESAYKAYQDFKKVI